MKALVVDDSRAMRLILRRILSEVGISAVGAENGRVAVEMLPELGTDISLVLVDWNMPEMNGYEFICKFREMPQYADVPVIMVTSESSIAQVAKAVEAGANEYIMKPFTREAVVDKLMLIGALPC